MIADYFLSDNFFVRMIAWTGALILLGGVMALSVLLLGKASVLLWILIVLAGFLAFIFD